MADGFATASWGRRVLALLVDWLAATLVTIALVGPDAYAAAGGSAGFVVLGVYVVESVLLTWLLAGSFGKLATGLRVVPADGVLRTTSPARLLLRLLVRQVLVALVIPPLVFRPDGRGLHDLAAGTATVPVATYRGLAAG